MNRKALSLLLFCMLLFSPASTLPAWSDPSERVFDDPWLVLRSLLVSYPDRISLVDYDSVQGDWFLEIDGTRLYWARGRLLLKKDLGTESQWRAYVDYLYPDKIPDPSRFTEETIGRLNAELLAEQRRNALDFNPAFYTLLYGGESRRKIEASITRFDWLTARVSVHRSLVPALKRIEQRLNDEAGSNPEVARFLSQISRIEGYNWREVRDSTRRSQHSWGIAVDILPVGWGQKNIYWNWISYWNEKWMLIPLDRRWMPPDAVVEIFEEEGFVWGGKWHLWDNMHFEYRPELIVLGKWGYRGTPE